MNPLPLIRAAFLFLYTIALFANVMPALAQATDNDTIYYDQKWAKIPPGGSFAFYRLPRVLTDSGYRLEDHFANGRLQMKGYATSPAAIILTGNTVHYDSLGHKTYEGSYRKGMKDGLWRYYFAGTESIKREVVFRQDVPNGAYRVYDSLTHRLIEASERSDGLLTGTSNIYYPDSARALRFCAHYKGGHLDSSFQVFFRNGALKRSEAFRDGHRAGDGTCYDSLGHKVKYRAFATRVRFRKSIDDIAYQEVAYPQIKRDKPFVGAVSFSFVLTKNGKITDKLVKDVSDNDFHRSIMAFMDRLELIQPMTIDDEPVSVKVAIDLDMTEFGGAHTRYTPVEEQLSDWPVFY